MNDINFSKVKKLLWIILFANLAVAAIKIAMGYMIKSSSLTADGFHSLTDGSSNIIGLIGIHFAAMPVDQDHPYGHSKFETLAGLFIAVMLFILGLRVVSNAILNILHPITPTVSTESLIAILITLIINMAVSKIEYQQGKKLQSTILISDSLHTRSDIFISLGVLCTLTLVRLGLPPIVDSMASLVVAAFVLHAAYEIFNETSSVLVDQAAVSTEAVTGIIMTFPQVRNVHKIRSRGSQHNIYIDLHLLIEPDMNIEASHKLMHDIEAKLCLELKKSVQTHIHLEPYYE